MKVDKLRTVIIYIILILLGLVCLLPLLNIVAISFSSSAAGVNMSGFFSVFSGLPDSILPVLSETFR